jgi:hypothetical protein
VNVFFQPHQYFRFGSTRLYEAFVNVREKHRTSTDPRDYHVITSVSKRAQVVGEQTLER